MNVALYQYKISIRNSMPANFDYRTACVVNQAWISNIKPILVALRNFHGKYDKEVISGSYRDKLYIFGGFSGALNRHFDDMYEFDPVTCYWTKINPVGLGPTARRRQCTVLVGHRVFLFGGTKYVCCFQITILFWHYKPSCFSVSIKYRSRIVSIFRSVGKDSGIE